MAKAILITKPGTETLQESKYWYPAESTKDWQKCPAFGIHLPFAQSLIADPATKIEFVEATADEKGKLVVTVLETLKEPT